jgi:hypothetical protein
LLEKTCATVVGFADHKAQREPKDGWCGKCERQGGSQGPGGLERVARRFENKFSKALDDAAKADQNLASLLLTNGLKTNQMTATKKASCRVLRKEVFKNT